jgi:hypothetical protein
MYKRKINVAALTPLPVLLAGLFLLGTGGVFSQESNAEDELSQRGSIPQELLRPRREGESPRYPVDTVIGPLGQGRASEEAYRFARRIATALLDGNLSSPALSSANKVFVENCINALNAVNPRFFRLGSGREEPDGAVSFLIRFVGREEGIMGELFVRHKEQRPPAPPTPPPAAEPAPPPSDNNPDQQETAVEREIGEDAEGKAKEIAEAEVEKDAVEEETVQAPPPEPPPPTAPAPVVRVWVFEDLILEEPRTREAETNEARHRYDFSPYERFF